MGLDAASDRQVLPWPDERIWVTLKPDWTPDPDLPVLDPRQCSTHPGHLHVSAQGRDLNVTVHPGDIADASPEARLLEREFRPWSSSSESGNPMWRMRPAVNTAALHSKRPGECL